MSWHVVPEGEEDRHELSLGCWCLPGGEVAQRPDGTWGMVVDHCDQDVMKIKTRSDDG